MRKDKVIEHFAGKQVLVAKALKLSKGAISQWGDIIPEAQAMRLERLTNGALVYDPVLYEQRSSDTAAA
ncbi:MAG: Cro/CI family transcriptional regulator [Gammaproteobacteria bacterium]|nr:Cro/CI family transcriptional regulator [Gammaproteobacteria bacterium]